MDSKDRFVKWHSILREQVSFVNNLFIAISTAIIGFLISWLSENTLQLTICQKILFSIGLILSILSFLAGLTASISRLFDFRTTTKKIRIELEKGNQEDLDDLKGIMRLYGALTWSLLYWQLGLMFFGMLTLFFVFVWIYFQYLF